MSGSNHQATRRRLRVLVTDDSEAIRTALSGLLARLEDVEIVGIASSGNEALEMIRELEPDAMTLDIRMPEMSGIRVLEAIRRERLKLSVIVLTGMDDDQYRSHCLNLGAEYFFNKATEFEQVLTVLAEKAASLNTHRGGQRSAPVA